MRNFEIDLYHVTNLTFHSYRLVIHSVIHFVIYLKVMKRLAQETSALRRTVRFLTILFAPAAFEVLPPPLTATFASWLLPLPERCAVFSRIRLHRRHSKNFMIRKFRVSPFTC